MIQVINDGHVWIFTNDRKRDFDKIKYDLGLEINSVDENYQVSNVKVPITKVLAKQGMYFILNDLISFKFENSKNFVNYLSLFPKHMQVNLDNVVFKNTFNVLDQKTIITFNKKISIIVKSETNNDAMNKFIYYIKRDNGHIISPLIKRFSKTAFLFGEKKRVLLGYANIKDYFDMINNREIGLLSHANIAKDLSYVFQLDTANDDILIEVVGQEKINVKTTGILKETKGNVLREPYLLFATTPIKIHDKMLPYFVSTYGKIPVFISIVTFMDDFMLSKAKGRINLLSLTT